MEMYKIDKLVRYYHLPFRMKWYEVDGKILFPLKGSTDLICYIIRYPHHPNDKKAPWYKYGIRLKRDWTLDVVFREIQNSALRFKKALRHADTSEHYKVDMNGGDLGAGDNRRTIIEEVSKLGYDLE